MRYSRICLALLLSVLFAMELAGCAALLLGGAAGAGSIVYIKGQLKEEMSASVTAVHNASISTLKEFNLPVIEDNHDKLSAKIKSRFADGQDVWIEIESVTAESCKMTIRVGIMGDERKSRQLLDAVHRHVSEAAPKS
jgi:hypothetical protein